ncbi:MAG: S-adenosylmethionine:tRNA ribosyltransferase-isomerase [Paramuribaculum sp.]|nr:S-adenosylmethionine:tRNA ribosyltransferase-isomerase [Paramuribaculum sp.]
MASTDHSDPRSITIDSFDYPLEESRIAAHPLAERDQCLLLVRTPKGELSTHRFTDLPALLPEGSMLVYNDTRVINARLRFRKATGAAIEVFCLEPHSPIDFAVAFAATATCEWVCFVGNSKRWRDGELTLTVTINGTPLTLTATRTGRAGNASIVRFSWDPAAGISFSQIIEAAGEIPIPPYLNRPTEQADSSDYQTVYSAVEGSVAAPTAGLHFTDRVLADIDSRGIKRRALTLHVGAGTFQPVKTETIADHEMHREFIAADRSLIAEIATGADRIIAVGTTSVRTLESLYHLGCMVSTGLEPDCVGQWYPYSPDHPELSAEEAFTALGDYMDHKGLKRLIASTRVIIAPGYRYRVVKGMITNFHQPKSTLLLLVSAFVDGRWREIYDYALAGDFRFLSYGDACLLL